VWSAGSGCKLADNEIEYKPFIIASNGAFKLNNLHVDATTKYDVAVCDVAGRIIFSGKLSGDETNELKNASSGIYICAITNKNNYNATIKFSIIYINIVYV
jgi:hypothetical protein